MWEEEVGEKERENERGKRRRILGGEYNMYSEGGRRKALVISTDGRGRHGLLEIIRPLGNVVTET